MVNRLLILLLISTSSIFLMRDCSTAPKIEDKMEEVDKAFIPVWCAVKTEDMYNAKRTFLVLNHRWNRFDNQYQYNNRAKLQKNFDDVNETISNLAEYIACNDAIAAAKEMDDMLAAMRSIRQENKLNYFLDHIWDFQQAYDYVSVIANDPKLHLMEWREFEREVECMNEQWEILKHQHAIGVLMDWNTNLVDDYVLQERKINRLIKELNEVVTCAEMEYVTLACDEIKPELLKMIALFGDFESSKTHYAKL